MFKRPKMSALVYCPDGSLIRELANWIRGSFGGLMLILMTASVPAQSTSGTFDDHQNMMNQLGIKKLRPGPNPNDQSTFDEATANPYTNSLPDVLTMEDGTKVTTAGAMAGTACRNSGRLRAGSLWPDSRKCAEGDLGSDRHHTWHQRRHSHRDQNLDRSCGQQQ